jgi:hypothetical protein
MHYLVDEDLSTEVAIIARGLGLDAVSVQERDVRGWKDDQLLELAAHEGRCIITANRNDFQRFTNQFAAEERAHADVLVVPYSLVRRGAAAIAHALLAFERTRGDFPMAYVCDFLQPADQ